MLLIENIRHYFKHPNRKVWASASSLEAAMNFALWYKNNEDIPLVAIKLNEKYHIMSYQCKKWKIVSKVLKL